MALNTLTMDDNKSLFAALLFALVLVLAISFVSADIVAPANGDTIAGTTALLNATNLTLPAMVNCTFYAQSSATANTTWARLSPTITNTTANQLSLWNATFDTRVLQDGNNYIFNASCANNSNAYTNTVTTASVTVDNGRPPAPTALTPTTDTDGSVAFSATVTDENTTACRLIFIGQNPGSLQYATTYSTTTCSHTLTIPEGTYTYRFQASDGTNFSNSTDQTLAVDVPSSAGAVAYLASQKNAESLGGAAFAIDSGSGLGGSNGKVIWIIVGILGAIGLLWLLIRS